MRYKPSYNGSQSTPENVELDVVSYVAINSVSQSLVAAPKLTRPLYKTNTYE